LINQTSINHHFIVYGVYVHSLHTADFGNNLVAIKKIKRRKSPTLTVWHPLLPYGYSCKVSCARLG